MESVYIKNMVCSRCIATVRNTFEKQGIIPVSVALGEVRLTEGLITEDVEIINSFLLAEGFEIVKTDTPILVIKIKAALVSLFDQEEIPENFKLSKFLTEKFPYDYSHLSRLFSNNESDTIEHFVINLRIEKAKELLTYKDQNVSEIAYRLGYVSAAHFSRQFKKLVGIAPSLYRDNPSDRKSLEKI